MGYPVPMADTELAGMDVRLSVTEKLRAQKQALEEQLSRVNDAIELLEKHPETQAVLDALSKLGMR